MKLLFVYLFLFLSPFVFANAAATVGDFIRNPDSSIQTLTQLEAKNRCLDLGSRLPTPREYAGYSISKGAIGLRETKFPNSAVDSPEIIEERRMNCRQGFCNYHLEKRQDGTIYMDFYFAPYGYKKPEPGFIDGRFWTSSQYAGSQDFEDLYVVFESFNGWFGLAERSQKHPARCIAF